MAPRHPSGPQFPWPPAVGGGHSSRPVPSPRCLSPRRELKRNEALTVWSWRPRPYKWCSGPAPSLAPASPPSRRAGVPPTPPRPPPAPCTPRVQQTMLPPSRLEPLPEPTPRPPTPARSVALGSPLQVGGGRVPSLGDCLSSAQRGGPGQVGSLFSAVLQTRRLPSNRGALRPAPCAWGRGCAPPHPAPACHCVTLSQQPGGAGGPGGTVSPFEARAAVDQLSPGPSAGSGQGPRLCHLQ